LMGEGSRSDGSVFEQIVKKSFKLEMNSLII
jgi:hypothetical protein